LALVKWTAEQMPALDGRTAVVTGANSGIGFHVARELAAHGARTVLACRDVERAKQAAERIRAHVPSADLDVAELDLASMASISDLALGCTEPLDLLVNNAAVMAPPKRMTTADGFELQFGTNHLGHFVLTGMLLPSLLAASTPRVVTVASIAHRGATADVVEGNAGAYRPQQAYRNSKLANLLFALELQREASARGLALTSVAAHPGVASTGLFVDPNGQGTTWLRRTAVPPLLRAFTHSPAAAARAVLYAATVARPGSYTGPRLFGETRGPIGPARLSALAHDASLARALWRVSEDVTGFHYPWPS
jgi:NAD(P)-dependent dehydrogenase (short-subunit alcohol dehydrogenase family)